MNLSPGVDDILLAKNGYITLALHGSGTAENGEHRRLNMLATFDQHFEVLDVQAADLASSPSLRAVNGAKTGLDGRLQMFPVLRWLDGRRMPPAPQTDMRPAR